MARKAPKPDRALPDAGGPRDRSVRAAVQREDTQGRTARCVATVLNRNGCHCSLCRQLDRIEARIERDLRGG